jgi:ATP-dependent protease HslVU (ClpYQ) ATPase subunit
VQDFEAILTQTHASLVRQYQALLATEKRGTFDFRDRTVLPAWLPLPSM